MTDPYRDVLTFAASAVAYLLVGVLVSSRIAAACKFDWEDGRDAASAMAFLGFIALLWPPFAISWGAYRAAMTLGWLATLPARLRGRSKPAGGDEWQDLA